MIDTCFHCQKNLNLSTSQRAKVEKALADLPAGKFLKLGCPNCGKSIELVGGASAPIQPPAGVDLEVDSHMPDRQPKHVVPPKAPDVSWLASGEVKKREVVEDVPMVLVLMPEGAARNAVLEPFIKTLYQPVFATSALDAMERMRFVNFRAVILHSGFEGVSLEKSTFHAFMRNLSMVKRRHLLYILIGPRFNTLYDLEALSLSANLVVNDRDVNNMVTIFKKALHDYEDLFGPFIGVLKEYGKK